MHRFILTCIFLFLLLPFSHAQTVADTAGLVPAELTSKSSKEVAAKNSIQKGDRIVYAQVLRLTDQNKDEFMMLVFADAVYENNVSRAKMKIDYVLKRERVYLGKIFFADVDVLEEIKNVVDMDACLKKMEQKYQGLRCWTLLNADAILPVASH